jgi:hypothetical protein
LKESHQLYFPFFQRFNSRFQILHPFCGRC